MGGYGGDGCGCVDFGIVKGLVGFVFGGDGDVVVVCVGLV